VKRALPVSEEAALRSISLPIYNGLLERDQDVVIEALRKAWK
jgi:dTDP-4-amino-4,6-dideoxygalactose transaminase